MSNHRVGMILFAGIILGTLVKNASQKEDSSVLEVSEEESVLDRQKQH